MLMHLNMKTENAFCWDEKYYCPHIFFFEFSNGFEFIYLYREGKHSGVMTQTNAKADASKKALI